MAMLLIPRRYSKVLNVGCILMALLFFVWFVATSFQYKILTKDKMKWIRNELNFGNISYDDPVLVQFVKKRYLEAPLQSNQDDLETKTGRPSNGQVYSLWPFLKDVTDGFFVHSGTHDEIFLSSKLGLDKMKGWTGIMIESDPDIFVILQSKYRKIWQANICLSPKLTPKDMYYFRRKENGSYSKKLYATPGSSFSIVVKAQCFPFYTIMLTLKKKVVDFFSLESKGQELDVLKTIPFDKVFIKTLAVEYESMREREDLEKFMIQKGYVVQNRIVKPQSQDILFVHSSLLPAKLKTSSLIK